MTTQLAVCPVRVGRDEELAAILRAAERRQTLLIGGPAGIGKSRLAAEALNAADEWGLSRLVGYCTPEAGAPYAPFVAAIRRRTRTLGPEDLATMFAGGAELAAALLPEAARQIGLTSEAPTQQDLFAAVWQLLHRLAGPAGAVLLVEDLHWADTDSLRLLAYLARETDELGVWIVGTYRTDELHRRHPLTATLGELGRERRHAEVVLGPLGREELRQMVSAIFDGTDVGDEFVDALLERTAGNPFFVEELAKVLVERGDIYRHAGEWERRALAEIEMPESVKETLVARARALEPAAQEILQLAALAGERIDLAVLAEAAGKDAAVIDDAIAEGLRLQLLAERREAHRSVYAFRHALTREAFGDELVGPDRQKVHRRMAEAIARVHAGDLDSVAAELTDHYGAAGDVARAIDFGMRAARRAVSSFACDEACRRYDQTLRLVPPEADKRLAWLLEAAETTVEGLDLRLAAAFASDARDTARHRSDPVAEARALGTLARVAWSSGDTQRALGLLEEALVLVEGRDDGHEGYTRARLARMLTLAGRVPEAEALLPDGIRLAGSSGNWRALSLLHGTRMMHAGHGPDFEASLQAGLAAARDGRDELVEGNLTTNAGYITLWCGELARSRELLEASVRLHERIAPHDRYALAGYAWLLALTGEYAEASRLLEPLVGVEEIPTRIVALTARYEIAERRGEPEAGQVSDELVAVAARTGEAQRSVPAMAASARRRLLVDGVDAASGLFAQVLTATTTERITGSHWMFSPDLARVLSTEQRLAELELWASDVSTLTAGDPHVHNRLAGGLVDAYLASARGETAVARSGLGAVAAGFASMPCPARELEAFLALADLEWRDDDVEASLAAARRAAGIAERIGAAFLGDRAAAAAARAEAPSVLLTVLFTDIVSSTERLSSVGDRAWRSTLEHHNAVVRRELGRWHGREVDMTGDGFVAAFETPAEAIRCGLSIRDALEAAGIHIRAGLHTGECQLIAGNLAGIAVHIAARVSAAAEAGEVLVSSTVRDLVAGSAFSFTDRGSHRLKGVPGEWRLLGVSR